jgi:meiotically up-regulated gene 157 (Mug157) protein
MKPRNRILLGASIAGLIAAQVQRIVISPLANGFNPDADLWKAKGPTTIEQDKLTFQPTSSEESFENDHLRAVHFRFPARVRIGMHDVPASLIVI